MLTRKETENGNIDKHRNEI